MAREQQLRRTLYLIATLTLPWCASAREIRLGSEFEVNTYTTSYQFFPSMAADTDGDFVVSWESFGEDGAGRGIFARRFSSAGAALAAEFQVNTYTTGNQRYSAVATEDDGDFVVVWESPAQDGSSAGVFARRFTSAGVSLATEFQVNTYTSSDQSRPAVAADSGGNFVVVWRSVGQDGDGTAVIGRRFTNTGAPVAGEFMINVYTSSNQGSPAVAADGDGDFVVAWESLDQDGSAMGVFARRFTSAGGPLATELQVSTFTASDQRYPAVGVDGEGDFVIAWSSNTQDGSNTGVFARRFSSAGVRLGGELQVNTYITLHQSYPTIAAAADGDFVVAWTSNTQDGSNTGVFARHFSSAGFPLTDEFQVNTYTNSYQGFPAAAADARGDFVVAWHSLAQDGSHYGIFAQRFANPITLDIDGDGSFDALTDGLLTLRYGFGFRGPTLVIGAVSGDCTRCDTPAIEAYLAGLTS